MFLETPMMFGNFIVSITEKLASRSFGAFKAVYQQARYRDIDPQAVRHLIIVGVQRSGTNMILRIFERGLPYAAFPETDARIFHDYELRPLNEVKRHTEASPAPFVALKPICDTHNLSGLMRAFPNSQALWVYRNVHDVVNSHIRKWTDMPESLRCIRADKDWRHWKAGGLSDHSHQVIREFVSDDINNETACALFWYIRNVQFFEQGHDENERVFLVPYDQVVADAEASVERLLRAMNVPHVRFMTRHIGASGKRRNKRPAAISEDVRLLCHDLEQRFQDHLQALSYMGTAAGVPPRQTMLPATELGYSGSTVSQGSA